MLAQPSADRPPLDAIAVCLLYGDYAPYAARLLRSLSALMDQRDNCIVEVRLGLNAVAPATMQLVHDWAAAAPVPVQTLQADNVGKYPMMRRLLRLSAIKPVSLNAKAIWFDDDAYVDVPVGWWRAWLVAQQTGATVTGKLYNWFVQPGQLVWYQAQPWYRSDLPLPQVRGRAVVRFVQGSFWTASLQQLLQLDWPIPELYHNGGDSLLGLRVAHAGGTLARHGHGVRVNCAFDGGEDRAARRGINSRPLGYGYPQTPIVIPDHTFAVQHTVWENYDKRQQPDR